MKVSMIVAAYNAEKYIKEASEKFEALLREQIKRAEDMKNAAGAKDFAALPERLQY